MAKTTLQDLAKILDSDVREIHSLVRPFSELSGIEPGDIVSGMALTTNIEQEDSQFFRKVDPHLTYGDKARWESREDIQATLTDRMFSRARAIDVWDCLGLTFGGVPREITLLSVGAGLGQEAYSFLISLNENLSQSPLHGSLGIRNERVIVNVVAFSKSLNNLIHIHNGKIPIEVFEKDMIASGERARPYFKAEGQYAKFDFSLLKKLEVAINPLYTDLETTQGRQLVEARHGDYVFFCNVYHHLDSQHQQAALDSVRKSVKLNGILVSDKCENGIEGMIRASDAQLILDRVEKFWRYNAPLGTSLETGKGGGILRDENCFGHYENLRMHILSLRSYAKEGDKGGFFRGLSQVKEHLLTSPRDAYFGKWEIVGRIDAFLKNKQYAD
ncbi:hypothetical protein HYU13_02160 [Candidatus Woesearchaeota archaeon]|nr:hypothetical protein [Candidatus Woesearchaeota archaeon]